MPAAVRLHHVDLGGAGNPPLVLLHGLLGSSRNWQTAGRELAVRHHVLALDARNHGRSPHAEAMDYDAMVEDVIAWMDAQGLAAATLMGHSMGGRTAMLAACRYPERCSRLIVVDVAPRDYARDAHRSEFAALNGLDLATLRSRQDAENRLLDRVPDLGMRKFLVTNLEQAPATGWRWIINLPALTAALPVLERNPLSAADRFDLDACFIVGGKSSYVRPEDHGVIRRHFPAARIGVIAESGHNPHMETRAEFVQRVLAAGA